MVELTQPLQTSAVKLQEIGPRMTLQLVKVEEGPCSRSVIFDEYGQAGERQENRNLDNQEDAEDNGNGSDGDVMVTK